MRYIMPDPSKVTCVEMEVLVGLPKGTINSITVTRDGSIIPDINGALTQAQLTLLSKVTGRAVRELTLEEQVRYFKRVA